MRGYHISPENDEELDDCSVEAPSDSLLEYYLCCADTEIEAHEDAQDANELLLAGNHPSMDIGDRLIQKEIGKTPI